MTATDTVVRVDVGDDDAGDAPGLESRGHRRRARWLSLALVTLTAAGIWLTAPGWGVDLAGDVPVVIGGDVETASLPDFGQRGTTVVVYEHGAEVRVTLPLRNDGVLSTTISEAWISHRSAPLVVVDHVEGLPVTLGPGDEAEVTLVGRLDNCEYHHEREVQVFHGAQVTQRAAGRTTTVEVSFRHDLVVHAPMIVGCPDGVLDRSLLNRRDLE